MVWQSVRRSLPTRHDFLRNGGAAAVLFVGADGVAQYMEALDSSRQQAVKDSTTIVGGATTNKETMCGFEVDQWRCLGAVLLGFVLGGGVYPTAYAQLDRLFPGRSWRTIVVKSAVEIATVGIAVNTTSLLGRASWQGTHGWKAVGAHVAAEIPRVTVMDARVWFPYNCIAFGLIPIHIRPLTTACMEAGWQTYISLRAHDYREQEASLVPSQQQQQQQSPTAERTTATI